jgi:hypothetical protein
MRDRLAKMKTGASNRQVAQVLESAKGTIDAHLFTVKGKLGELPDKDRNKEGEEQRDGHNNAANR